MHKENTQKMLLKAEDDYRKIMDNQKKAEMEDDTQQQIEENIKKLNSNDFFDKDLAGNVFKSRNKISLEYLRNVTIKYMEATAVGNELECKILEKVIFSILEVTEDQIKSLEDKRLQSYYYFNLWYNAKAYITSSIYGQEEERKESE